MWTTGQISCDEVMIMNLVLVVECNASGEPMRIYFYWLLFLCPFGREETSKPLPMDWSISVEFWSVWSTWWFPAGYYATCGHSMSLKLDLPHLRVLLQTYSNCGLNVWWPTLGKELLQADVETVAWWPVINFSSCELVCRMLCALHEYIHLHIARPFSGAIVA